MKTYNGVIQLDEIHSTSYLDAADNRICFEDKTYTEFSIPATAVIRLYGMIEYQLTQVGKTVDGYYREHSETYKILEKMKNDHRQS